MRTSPVRSLLLWSVGCVLLAAWASVSDAAACAKICKQTSIWGSGPGPTFAPCECTTIIGGLGSGANGCGCGICYQQVSTRVIGYAKLTDGQCPSGSTDCGDCDSDSESGSGSNLTKTTAPPSTESTATNTPSPSLTSSAPSPTSDAPSSAAGNNPSLTAPPAVTTPAVTTPAVTTPTVTTPVVTTPVVTTPAPTPLASKNTTATDVTSNGSTTAADGKSATAPTNVSAATEAPSTGTTKSSSNDGLATWQIALIICSCVLVIAVAMTTITSCYCKARNRMKDNMQDEEERHEYEGYWNPNASGGLTERSGQDQLAHSAFNPAMTQAGRSSFTSTHSRPNSTKNMPYSEPTYAVDERISAGMGVRPAPRSSIGSVADLPGVFQPFPQRDIRPSHEVGSRKNIAIEL